MPIRFLPVLAAALAAAPAVHADPTALQPPFGDPVAVSVQLGDLRLDQPRGVEVALRRMTRAAGEACGPPPESIRAAEYRARYRYCAAANMDALVRGVGALPGAALHAEASHSPVLKVR